MTSDPFRNEGGPTLQALGFEITLDRRKIADLHVPSGRVVVCDPFEAPETEPFDFDVAPGTYPVYLMMADLRDTLTVAYVVLELSSEAATRWELAALCSDDDEESRRWNDPAHAGFHVESGIAALLDEDVAGHWIDAMATEAGEDDLNKLLRREVGKARRGNNFRVGWAAVDLGSQLNLVAIEVADGTYRSHLGRDADGAPALLVIDLGVLDIQFTPYGLRF